MNGGGMLPPWHTQNAEEWGAGGAGEALLSPLAQSSTFSISTVDESEQRSSRSPSLRVRLGGGESSSMSPAPNAEDHGPLVRGDGEGDPHSVPRRGCRFDALRPDLVEAR